MTEARFTIAGGGSVGALFDGWAAGYYSLPPDLIARGRGFVALREAEGEAEARCKSLRDAALTARHLAAVDALVAATNAAGQLPADPLAGIRAVRQEAEQAKDTQLLMRDVVQRAGLFLEGSIIADQVVAEYLRPAYMELIDTVRELLPDLTGIDVTATQSVSAAGPKAGRAYLALADAAVRLGAILAARRSLRHFGGPGYRDLHDYFADTAAIPAGERVPTVGTHLRGAGPAEPLSRLLWLAGPDGRPDLPTLAEQDDRADRFGRYVAVLGESMGGRRSPEAQRRIDAAYEVAAA